MALTWSDIAGAWRRPADDSLPERVRVAIRVQEERGEILIGWVQLALVITFGVLYGFAPRAEGDVMIIAEPVPWALGAYFGFTLIRLILAYRRFIPDWFLLASVIVDIALLMGLIWTFHIQYGQPPSFYLKAPTLLYVFIFIALRALRFEPRYVLLTGVVAAAGWGAMLAYAVDQGGPEMITRDFVAYITGNAILLGAEFDKMISILVVTLILTVALTRARGMLIAAVREEEAARDLKRFFAPEVAQAITGADRAIAAGEGQVRQAAVLITDLRGFTKMSANQPPAEVIRIIADYQARLVPVIREHGGSVDKFLGDGILATFGATSESESYAADACRCAQAVFESLSEWNDARIAEGARQRLQIGAAVAVGEVIVGAVGDGDRLEYTVLGDAVNLAAKLEKQNKVEETCALTTETAFELAARQGFTPAREPERRPGRPVADVTEPVDLVVLASPS
jgi:adenylate cyclase